MLVGFVGETVVARVRLAGVVLGILVEAEVMGDL